MKLKKKIRRFFNYWSWRITHPTAPYEQFYVHRVLVRINSGQTHPAIGPGSRPLREESELLKFLRKHGIQSGDLTIDYGCGSLRLAPPLIDFLEPGKYWGMDLAQEFLDFGRAHLPLEMIETKKPRLDVIADEAIERVRAEKPRYIISWHVCSKVPDNRFDAYIGNITRMMTPGATALIHFPETAERRKLTGLAWTTTRAMIKDAVKRAEPRITCEIASVIDVETDGIRQSYAVLKYPS